MRKKDKSDFIKSIFEVADSVSTSTNAMKTFKFEKDTDNRWYIVLPEWEGDRSELEMVCGADTLLDIVAQGETIAYLTLSETPFEGHDKVLTFLEESCGGGDYLLTSKYHQFDVWLCHVTKFVFGYLPKILYCK